MKRGFLFIGALLFLSAGIPVGQDQPDRSRFYALQVVCEKNVQNAKDSLGAPDGRSAEILLGGQLVVLMENILLPSLIVGYGEMTGCLDSGSVVGEGETDFGLEGRFTWQDSEGKHHRAWIPLLPTLTGFCVLPVAIYPFEDSAGVDMIRITNPSSKSLFMDAVIGYKRQFC